MITKEMFWLVYRDDELEDITGISTEEGHTLEPGLLNWQHVQYAYNYKDDGTSEKPEKMASAIKVYLIDGSMLYIANRSLEYVMLQMQATNTTLSI